MRKVIALCVVMSSVGFACRGGSREWSEPGAAPETSSDHAGDAGLSPVVAVDPEPSGDAGCAAADPYANVNPAELTTLHFTTGGGLPGNPPPRINLDITVTDVTKVRALFAETNSLPCGLGGAASCPVDYAIDYRLAFSGPSGTFTFDIDPSGCEWVTINGVPYAEVVPPYWGDLAAALGVPESDFEGPLFGPQQ